VIYQNHSQINTPYVINIIVNPIFINLNTRTYITLYIICNLTTLVKICITIFLNTLIILTCTIKLKIYISCNKTLIDYRIRVIHHHVADKMDLSCIGINIYRLGNTKSIVSGYIISYYIEGLREFVLVNSLYLDNNFWTIQQRRI